MEAALNHLRASGYPVQDSDLEHLSPITSAHINLHGSHHLDLQAPQKAERATASLMDNVSAVLTRLTKGQSACGYLALLGFLRA